MDGQTVLFYSICLSHDDKMEGDVNERTSLLGNFGQRSHINSPASVKYLCIKPEHNIMFYLHLET